MKLKELMDNIQGHPLFVALGFFVVAFLLYNVAKKPAGSATPALAPGTYIDPVTGAVTARPTVQDTYAQQFNQYPTTNVGTQINQNGAPTPTPTPTPTPVPVGVGGTSTPYHGILTVGSSKSPANIGPWVGGRSVTYQGVTYILDPGPQDRLWGDIVGGPGHGEKVLMWDGTH